jgi:hypothetical protein
MVGIAVRTGRVKERVDETLTAHGVTLPVRVRPNWYY